MTLKTALNVRISPLMQMVSINSWNGTKTVIVYAEGRKKLNNKIRVQNGSICYETRTSPHLIFKYRPIKNSETNLLNGSFYSKNKLLCTVKRLDYLYQKLKHRKRAFQAIISVFK